jgi:hypothetical protein
MYECRCLHDGKMLAEIARPRLQAMTGGQLCACGRWAIPKIDLEFDQIILTVRTVRCLCGYQSTGVAGFVVRIQCSKCKKIIRACSIIHILP